MEGRPVTGKAGLPRRWTLVQHSGFAFGEKPGFEHAVETAFCSTKSQADRVASLGGLLLDYPEADAAEDRENYPKGTPVQRLYPNARGTFVDYRIGGRRLYVPPKEVPDATAEVL